MTGTMQALTWAFSLTDCDPLQRLAALYFAQVCGSSSDATVIAEISIAEFAAWAGIDSDLSEQALASLDDFDGVECCRVQSAGYEISLSLIGDRTPIRAPRDQLLRNEPYYLYVIATKAAVKVGITRNPKNRMKSFRTSIPDAFDIKLLGLGARSSVVTAESTCHQALNDYRITGEWFNCHPGEAVRVARRIMADLDIKEVPTA